jgi:hypothetical protein
VSTTYDASGNLLHAGFSSAAPDGTTSLDYVIDGENRRVGRKVNGALANGFPYQDAVNAVAQLDSSGNVVSRFVFGTKANVPDYYTTSSGTFRILSDHLASSRLVVNTSSGAVVEQIDYDEFGVVTRDTAPGRPQERRAGSSTSTSGRAISIARSRCRAARARSRLWVWTPAAGASDLVSYSTDTSRGAMDLGGDGRDLVWLSGAGHTDPAGWFPTIAIMTSPFTTDPKQLAPRRLRSEEGPYFGTAPFVVGCGYAARQLPEGIRVVRLVDGALAAPWRLHPDLAVGVPLRSHLYGALCESERAYGWRHPCGDLRTPAAI